MKRLLASGIGDIYQICKTFRGEERGDRHNPEFSMLEWYRTGYDLNALIHEVAELVHFVSPQHDSFELRTYQQVFEEFLQIDPFSESEHSLNLLCKQHCAYSGPALDRDSALNLLLSAKIESKLGKNKLLFLHDYPASQASLATVRKDAGGNLVANRFELYINGLELANGYHELQDADEQERRFNADNAQRARLGLPHVEQDKALIQALRAGMPACAGVALGLDRLLMVMGGYHSIDQVLAFPAEKA